MGVLHFCLFARETWFLREGGVFDAERFVAAPGEDCVGVWCMGAHVGEDVGSVVAVEEVVEGFACAVERYQCRGGEIADEVEEDVVVAAEALEHAEAAVGIAGEGC